MKRKTKKPIGKSNLPLSVTRQDGKTTIRQLKGRRFVRFGEVAGKTIASLELFTSDGDSHAFTLRFQDRTVLHLGITPGFTIKPSITGTRGCMTRSS